MRSFSVSQAFYSLLSATFIAATALPSWSADTATTQKGGVTTDAKATETKAVAAVATPVTPGSQEARTLVGRAYNDMRISNWPFAVAELCSALRFERNNALARRYLCYSLLQSGNPRDAISQLDALSSLNQPIPFDQCMRGEALAMMGDTDKSVEALKAALAMDTSSDYIRNKLIEILQSLAKYQEAGAYCSEGYFNAKTVAMRTRYLTLYNTLQQQRALLAQRTLGIQIAATSSYPMMAPPARTPAIRAVVTAKADPKAAAATTDDADDEDATPAATPAVTTTTTKVTTTSTTTRYK